MLLDWNQQSFSQYESIIICITLKFIQQWRKKCSFGSCVRVGVFLCSVQSKGSDKVDVEAIYCQPVLDNTTTGEISDRFSVLLERIDPGTGAKNKAALLSVISEHSFQNDPIRFCSLINCSFFSMLQSPRELAHGNWVQISPCKTRTLQPDGEGVHTARWNEWLLERKFNRQLRASVHVHEMMRWERQRESLVILPLSAPKLRLSHRCVAERTTIPPSSTRFSAYTGTSA